MQYLYSALLLHKSEQEITDKAVSKVLKAAGVEVDESRVKALVAALSEIDIEEALATAIMAPAASVASGAGEVQATTEKPDVEEEEEEEEEGEIVDDDEGLGSLFG